MMKIKKILFPALISSLLTGCWLLGDYTPSDEIGRVTRTNAGFCFPIKNPSDYYAHYLSIRDRDAPEKSGFNRKLPALTIADSQLCIPEKYYQFPDSGEINVEIALRSPTNKRIRRFIVSEFTMVKGEPHPFSPGEYSIPLPDVEE